MEQTVKYRLEQFLKNRGIKKTEFAKAIGVSNSYITSMRKSIQPDKLEKINYSYPDLNISWLLYGDGTMLRDTETETESAPAAKPAGQAPAENPDTVAGMIELQKGYQQMLAKSQEQIDRLISIIEDMRKS